MLPGHVAYVCRICLYRWKKTCIADRMSPSLKRWLGASLTFLASATIEGGISKKAEHAVLLQKPVNVASRDLFFGPGGKSHQPRGPFRFISEDLNGTNPKFVIEDHAGIRWTVKLGAEGKAEVAASRLIWAAGYFANEDYYLDQLTVANMPARLHRGQKFVLNGQSVRGARLKRHSPELKAIGTWSWNDSPFRGTPELNRLRALMALINNWDLTDENNAILLHERSGERIYMVSDVGGSFGTGDLTWPLRRARGDVGAFAHSRFISRESDELVDFRVPPRPAWFFLFTPREYASKLRLRWIGRDIPRGDARRMGEILARMSVGQIRDAFRAAGYSPDECRLATRIIEERIAELRTL